nr:EamA family transporter [Vandammella animalimorsus]
MPESLQHLAWLWVPITLFAALAQTMRNTAQRSLIQELGTLPATLVRFLYGLPFAALWLALLYLLPAQRPALPDISLTYLGWIALGALFQLAGTAALLLAMKERNFAVAVTLSKTEVLLSYLVSRRLLREHFSRAEKIGMGLMLLGLVVICLQA